MKLQEKIQKDLLAAMKEKDEEKKNAIRIIKGEMGRMDKKKLSDDEVIKIIKNLIKSEKETLSHSGTEQDSPYINILSAYLPQMASEDEIRQWIKDNVDFTQLKSKMQAMGPIMKHFGSTVDGNAVKRILMEI